MAISPLDKPPYTPLFPPPVGDIDLQQVENWVKQELDTIARYATAQPGTLFTPGNAIPSRPRTGILTYADGVNWNPGYGEGLYVFKQGVWVPVGVGAGSRIRLTTATPFFFDTAAGNDNNPGTSALPWASSAPLGSRYDFGNQAVTLNLKNNATTGITLPVWLGGGSLILDLGAHSIALPGAGTCITTPPAAIPGPITIKNGTLSAVNGDALFAQSGGEVIIGSGMNWGVCGNTGHIQVIQGCTIRLESSYNITGSATRHWRVYSGGAINNFGNTMSVNVSAGLAFGIFALVDNGGVLTLQFGGLTFTGAGAGTGSTGQKYRVSGNGIINTGGQGTEYFPGTAFSGTKDNGGQYL